MRRRLLRALPLVILAAMLALRVVDPGPIRQIRDITFDTYQRLQPRAYDPTVPVKIVDIDDASLARLGQWPWPRTLLARLVDRLAEMGAAAIAFDIVFAEPDRTSPALVLPFWPPSPEVEALRRHVSELPSHDAILAAAFARARVVTGFVLTHGAATAVPAVKGTFAHAGDDPGPFVAAFEGAVVNLPELEAAALGNGAVNALPEQDQVIRRVPLVFRMGDTLYPSLAAEALRVAQGARTHIIKSSGASGETAFGERTGLNSVRVGDVPVSTDANGRLVMRYTGSVPERYIPAWQVLEPDFLADRVAGQIVFIGTSAPGLYDLRSTPLNPVTPGVEIHAQVIEQILTGEFLRRPDFAVVVELAYMLGFGLVLVYALPRIGALWSMILGAAAGGAAIAGSWTAYDTVGWLLDPVYPSFMVLLVFVATVALSYLRSEMEKRQVREAFGRYLSPVVVERLASDPSRLTLGGELRTMTVMFADIRGFTSIAERFKDDPQGLTTLINRFLTPMTEAVLAHNGTIDKYIGDCLMAFWNAPLDDPQQAANACRAALAVFEALDRLNAELAAEAPAAGSGRPIRLAMGVGISTGSCVVGNMGSRQRFDYSVLGDPVNLASRLEGQTKTYGVGTVVGEATRTLAPEFAALELDLIAVKGKREAVRVYGLLGPPSVAEDPAFRALAERHGAMLAAFRGQRWAEARELLHGCAALEPKLATLYELYRTRVDHYERHPPGPDWDGVFVAETK